MAPVVTVLTAQPGAQTAAPSVTFRLRISTDAARVHAMALRCQVHIEARRRPYDAAEKSRLYELFGDSSQFERMLRPLVWAQCPVMVPRFEGTIECDLPVPCSYDLEVGAAKYLHAIRDGIVPLTFLFSGTIFRVSDSGSLTIEPVPWDVEASYPMPAGVWRAAMDRFFPGAGWIRMRVDTIDRLQAFRGRMAVVTWDEAIECLLSHAGEAPAQASGGRLPG
jgi:hypothetical protein